MGREEVLTHATTWMNTEDILLSKEPKRCLLGAVLGL